MHPELTTIPPSERLIVAAYFAGCLSGAVFVFALLWYALDAPGAFADDPAEHVALMEGVECRSR